MAHATKEGIFEAQIFEFSELCGGGRLGFYLFDIVYFFYFVFGDFFIG